MAHSSSPESPARFTGPERTLLLDTAADSIEYGFHRREPLPVDAARFPPALRAKRGTFVTLLRDGDLRGCIGTIAARDPLIVDVAGNAFQAAFRDPRFPPVLIEELDHLAISVSVLTPPRTFPVESEEDLLEQLRPGVDGLILDDGIHKATFLPAVWESLPAPRDFLHHLKQKAGLPDGHWSRDIVCSRYTAEVIR